MLTQASSSRIIFSATEIKNLVIRELRKHGVEPKPGEVSISMTGSSVECVWSRNEQERLVEYPDAAPLNELCNEDDLL